MAVTHFPDGITIGPGGDVGDRLPLYAADSWNVDQVEFGTMAAGEVKTIELTGLTTLRFGSHIISARPMNPESYNNSDILVLHTWCSEAGKLKLMVKNISANEITVTAASYNADQWAFLYISTDAT